MSGLGSGAPGRETMTDETPRRGIGWQILAIVAIGLVLRLIMAYGYEGLRGSGFDSDLGLFRYWAASLAEQGPFGFYDRGFFADYTPGYLYALWLVGVVGQFLGGIGDLIKLPAILTDVALGYIVYRMARDLGVSERRATLAGAVVIVNPITWFDSVVWGQVDSFGTVFLLLSVRELWKARSERAAILAVVAALVKPQLAILVPDRGLRHDPARPLAARAASATRPRPSRPGSAGSGGPPAGSGSCPRRIAGFATAVVLSAPFGISVVSFSGTAPFVDSSLVRLILSTASTYSYVTVNAYNLWALFPVDGQSMATNGAWIFDAPVADATTLGVDRPVPGRRGRRRWLLGLLLFVVVPFLVARRPDRLTILVGVSVLALAFFAVPTRVHERYLFPLFALAAIPFAFSWRWRIAYIVASVATFLNMYVVLTTLYPDNPSIRDWLGIGEQIRSQAGVTLVALLNTGVFLWAFAQLRPAARDARWRGARGGTRAARRRPRRTAPPGAVGVSGAPVTPGVSGLAGRHRGRRRPGDGAWSRRGSTARRGRRWGRSPGCKGKIDETPIRPDRSRLLATEGRGPVRPAGPVDPDRARRRRDGPAHVPAGRARPDALRRGLPRADGRRVPAGLALRPLALHLRVDAPAPREVRDGGRHRPVRRPRHGGDQRPRRARCATRPSSRAGRTPSPPSARDGDRVWVVTGSALSGYDLHTRKEVASWSVPGASAMTYDADRDRLYVGTETRRAAGPGRGHAGRARPRRDRPGRRSPSWSPRSTARSPAWRRSRTGRTSPPSSPGTRWWSSTRTRAARRVARSSPARSTWRRPAAATRSSRRPPTSTTPRPRPSELAAIIGGDAASYEASLADVEQDTVVVAPVPTGDTRAALQSAIDDGRLTGITIEGVPRLAVAGSDGLTLLTGTAGDAGDGRARRRRAGPRPRQQHRGRHAALRHHPGSGHGRAAAEGRRGHRGRRRRGPRGHRHPPPPGPGTRVLFDAGGRDGRGPGHDARTAPARRCT